MFKKKYLISLGILVLLGCILGYWMLAEEKNEPVASSPTKNLPLDNPVAEYVIPANEIEGLQRKASNGDCRASYRLARYHENVTLHLWDSIKWLRLAAKCPDVRPKEELIMLLLPMRDRPDVAAEIDRLLSEMKGIDSERAEVIKKEMEAAIRRRRL